MIFPYYRPMQSISGIFKMDFKSEKPMPLQPIKPTRILSLGAMVEVLPKIWFIGKALINAKPPTALEDSDRK